jgi:hypothetical protein
MASGYAGGPQHLELRLLINSHCPIISVGDSGRCDLSAEGLCALLRERQDQPALARSGGRISRRATIELPKELAADSAGFQLGLPSAGDCCRE